MVAVGTIKLRRADDRQRDTDGVAAAQHQCGTGLIHPGDKLGQGEASFHITAHGV